ncbi:MAG: hypothetical protein M1816_003157 [Peltula sp. TS41687]|nr:MAG: hypothetical protein M1816_003157 [Peltula sp. TS41687]
MLMSWGGEEAWRCDGVADELPEQETERTVQEVKRLGIEQGDIKEPNILWNEELGRVMLIDFEFASVVSSADKEGNVAGRDHW